jgi:hypothetical protein
MGLIIFHDDPVLLRSLPLIKITGCPEDLKAKTPPDSWSAQRCNSERRFGLNRGNTIATWRAKAPRGWILSGAESAQEPDRYGDESSTNP